MALQYGMVWHDLAGRNEYSSKFECAGLALPIGKSIGCTFHSYDTPLTHPTNSVISPMLTYCRIRDDSTLRKEARIAGLSIIRSTKASCVYYRNCMKKSMMCGGEAALTS